MAERHARFARGMGLGPNATHPSGGKGEGEREARRPGGKPFGTRRPHRPDPRGRSPPSAHGLRRTTAHGGDGRSARSRRTTRGARALPSTRNRWYYTPGSRSPSDGHTRPPLYPVWGKGGHGTAILRATRDPPGTFPCRTWGGEAHTRAYGKERSRATPTGDHRTRTPRPRHGSRAEGAWEESMGTGGGRPRRVPRPGRGTYLARRAEGCVRARGRVGGPSGGHPSAAPCTARIAPLRRGRPAREER